MQYSNLAAKQLANDMDRAYPHEFAGRVRVAVVDLTVTAADKALALFTLPAGRVRILGASSMFTATFATAATTLKIGYAAYTGVDGVTVSADDDALLAATSGTNLASGKTLVTAGYTGLVLESMSGIDIIGTASANLAADDVVKGVVLYVVD